MLVRSGMNNELNEGSLRNITICSYIVVVVEGVSLYKNNNIVKRTLPLFRMSFMITKKLSNESKSKQ